jgi:hypothetical protein
MRGNRRVLGIEGVADEDEYDEFAELPAKGSRTKHKERLKTIGNPKFIRGQPNDPSSPCTWELICNTIYYVYLQLNSFN